MVSFLRRLSLPFLLAAAIASARQIFDVSFLPGLNLDQAARRAHGIARSKHTVAQDRRAAAKRRAKARAKRLGQA